MSCLERSSWKILVVKGSSFLRKQERGHFSWHWETKVFLKDPWKIVGSWKKLMDGQKAPRLLIWFVQVLTQCLLLPTAWTFSGENDKLGVSMCSLFSPKDARRLNSDGNKLLNPIRDRWFFWLSSIVIKIGMVLVPIVLAYVRISVYSLNTETYSRRVIFF